MWKKKQLVILFCLFPATVEPPPLIRVLSDVRFNKFSEVSGVVKDITLLIFGGYEGERWFDNESVVV